MSKNPFHFKQFTIAQDRCAMKIGTDGVLLGAWATLEGNPDTILDIGTGTGVVALMLAQRSDAETIDALELDADAYEQAVDNFEANPWGDRLFCYHAHLEEFAAEMDETYDLIVCNPPYFDEDQQTPSVARNRARFEAAMPFGLLVASVDKLLNPEGVFCVVLSRKREEGFIALAAKQGLFPFHTTSVKGNENAAPKRSLMAFSRKRKENKKDELTIEVTRQEYTEDYKKLVQDFYLKM